MKQDQDTAIYLFFEKYLHDLEKPELGMRIINSENNNKGIQTLINLTNTSMPN